MKYKLFYLFLVLFLVALIVSPDYDFGLLNTGIYFVGENSSAEELKRFSALMTPLFVEEGLYGTVLVDEEKGKTFNVTRKGVKYEMEVNTTFHGSLKTMKLNGKIQCGSGRLDVITTGLLGGLPIALDKKGDVLNIGLGCGLTLGVLEKGDFESIDTLEVDSVVVEGSKEFEYIFGGFLDNEKSNIIIDDARNYLLKTDKKYDVIVNEPSHPFSLGSANLITQEFFVMMKEHLKEDGIVVQWMPRGVFTSCDKDGIGVFQKTFASVFPYYYGFLSKTKIPAIQTHFAEDENGNVELLGYSELYDHADVELKYGEIVLVGSLKPLELEKYFGEIHGTNELKKYYDEVKIFDLNEHYIFSYEDSYFSEEIEINTDDKPVLDFIAARSVYLPKNLECDE